MNSAEELRWHLKESYRALSLPGSCIRFPKPQRFAPGLVGGHFHLRAELFIQRQATTRFQFPAETLDLGPGEILIVPAKVHHAETILPDSVSFRNVVLYADENELSCHLADRGAAGKPRISYPENLEGQECGRVAGWLEDTVQTALDFEDSDLAVDLVRSILGLTLKLLDHPASRGEDEPLPVVRCRQMIHEDLGNPDLSVAFLAQKLGCSADYLSHLFRTVRGEKLTTYIEELRMLRASELLTKTALSCKEVAWASGYSNQSYFILCFRRRWGASPGEWRQGRH